MKSLRRLAIMVAVISAATAATAAAALALTVQTLPPTFGESGATFYGVVGDCTGGIDGYFLLTNLNTGRTYDSLFDLGHPDQFGVNGLSYSEGPFGLEPDTDYAVRAAVESSCGNATGNTVFFRTAVGPGSPADVGITQSIGASPKVGQLLAINVTATNGSKTAGTDAFIKDIMPAGFQYVACSLKIDGVEGGFCSWDGVQTVVGDIGTFAPGSTVTLSIGVRPTAAGSFVNSVGVGAHQYDPDASNNFADAPVTVAAG